MPPQRTLVPGGPSSGYGTAPLGHAQGRIGTQQWHCVPCALEQGSLYNCSHLLPITCPLQDSYLEEALKVRNLLEEFGGEPWTPGPARAARRARVMRGDGPLGARRRRILGMREHVFTGAVSSLASFMSAQETTFVTLGQRVLANPLKVGHHSSCYCLHARAPLFRAMCTLLLLPWVSQELSASLTCCLPD